MTMADHEELDPRNPKHADLVRNWIGQFTDEQLVSDDAVDRLQLSRETVGEVIRESLLDLIDRIENGHADREAAEAIAERTFNDYRDNTWIMPWAEQDGHVHKAWTNAVLAGIQAGRKSAQ